MAQLGFNVIALDTNQQLLDQLTARKALLPIKTIRANLLDFPTYVKEANVVVCMGDTIAHLDSFEVVRRLIQHRATIPYCPAESWYFPFGIIA